MIVQLPDAGWHKQIVRIADGATSGWDWHGPEGSRPFLGKAAELPVGSLVVSHGLKSKAFVNKTALWVIVDGPTLYRAALVPADDFWATSLAPYARPLLQMTDEAITLWAVQQILERSDTASGPPIGCEAAASKSRFKSELANLRRLYAGRLAEVDCTVPYVEASFRLWMAQQSGVCGLSSVQLYDVLRDRCDLYSIAHNATKVRGKVGFRLTIGD